MKYSKLVTIFVTLVCISNVYADLIPGVDNICQLNGEFKVRTERATDTTKYFAYGVSLSVLKNLLNSQVENFPQTSALAIKLLKEIKSKPMPSNFENSCRENHGTVSFEWEGNDSGGRTFPICTWYDSKDFTQDIALGYVFANSLLSGNYYIPKEKSNVIFPGEMKYIYKMVTTLDGKWEQFPLSESGCPTVNYDTFNNLKNKL